ncbi:MAG: hypothetical protein K0Q57_435 [Gammaproteobacteria bacterium]|jgi:uncharacterized protein YjcR|nr:hypothetical protein [Gammaproteobacteria bacterium]
MKIEKQPCEPEYAFQKAKPCGAKTRNGTSCLAPSTKKGRCRLHGGAKGSGAPKGNKNALKQGLYTKDIKLQHLNSRHLIKDLINLEKLIMRRF